MTTPNNQGPATRIIHNRRHKDAFGSPYSPVYNTTTYRFENTADLLDVIEGRSDGNLYTRWGTNPSIQELEQGLARLENAEAALGFASGMAAISATLLAHGRNGIVCVGDLYGGTQELLKNHCQALGIPVTFLFREEQDQLAKTLTEPGKLVYFETPANPNMRLVDISHVSEIAHEAGATVIVDNTYATPYLTRPIELGADLVLHSATKYLGGHGDVVAGLVAGRADQIQEIRLVGMKDMTGAVMAPFSAMLILRGLKTLALRMDRHCASAQKVAEWLQDHPAVSKVYFPGLESFEQHELANRQMSQPGGMIAFELKGGLEAGISMMNGLKMIQRAVSLGDAETLIQHPASMTHSTYTPEERAAHGISDGLVRLSVGLEDLDDILEDLAQAMPQVPVAAAA